MPKRREQQQRVILALWVMLLALDIAWREEDAKRGGEEDDEIRKSAVQSERTMPKKASWPFPS